MARSQPRIPTASDYYTGHGGAPMTRDEQTSKAMLDRSAEAGSNGTQPPTSNGHTDHPSGALVGARSNRALRPLHDWRSLQRWASADARTWGYRITSPLAVLTV